MKFEITQTKPRRPNLPPTEADAQKAVELLFKMFQAGWFDGKEEMAVVAIISKLQEALNG